MSKQRSTKLHNDQNTVIFNYPHFYLKLQQNTMSKQEDYRKGMKKKDRREIQIETFVYFPQANMKDSI